MSRPRGIYPFEPREPCSLDHFKVHEGRLWKQILRRHFGVSCEKPTRHIPGSVYSRVGGFSERVGGRFGEVCLESALSCPFQVLWGVATVSISSGIVVGLVVSLVAGLTA
jgi:hypothetical protein